MKKYSLLASTLIVATALAVPAFADDDIALLATDGIMPLATVVGTGSNISVTNNSSSMAIGDIEFRSGSYLLVDATSTWTVMNGNLTFDSGSEIILSVNVSEDGTNSARAIISGNYSVSISTGTSITLTIDISDLSDEVTEFTVGIISGGSYTFDDDTTTSDLNLIAKFMDGDSEDTSWDYNYSVVVDYNGLSLAVSRSATAIPEPSMFGILFGLGAIGLVATRRRRA